MSDNIQYGEVSYDEKVEDKIDENFTSEIAGLAHRVLGMIARKENMIKQLTQSIEELDKILQEVRITKDRKIVEEFKIEIQRIENNSNAFTTSGMTLNPPAIYIGR